MGWDGHPGSAARAWIFHAACTTGVHAARAPAPARQASAIASSRRLAYSATTFCAASPGTGS